MAFTKQVARHDKITIDGTDYSNAFRTFGVTNDDSVVDVAGFSVTGSDETLSGTRAQGFTGEMFSTAETLPAMWTIYQGRSSVLVKWQPDGLVDSSRETWNGYCQLRTFSPSDTRGDAATVTLTFTASTSDGVYLTGT